MKPFTLEINLDDEDECRSFIDQYTTTKGRRLANMLGFKGKWACRAANALSGYAWNKLTAIECRLRGDIQTARQYEAICDSIYANDIQLLIECW